MSESVFMMFSHGLTQWSLGSVLIWFLISFQITIMGVTIYLHRVMAHRAADLHPLVSHFFRFWCWLTTGMVTREWVAIHRKHHAYCEPDGDPHSPRVYGLDKVVLHGVQLYTDAAKDQSIYAKFAIGCPTDWIERNVYQRHSWMGPGLLLIVNFLAFGIPGIAMWAIQMLIIPVLAAGVINGIGHAWGYRNFATDDTSTNITPWAFVIGGEELHNNHHAFPSSARFALRRFEFDLGWQVLRGLELVGLAKILRVAPKLDIRPNIDMPDADTLKAVLTHRWQVMTDYFANVLAPSFQSEAKSLPRRLRRAFRNGGEWREWLSLSHQEKLQLWLAERPDLAYLDEFRTRLRAIYSSGLRPDSRMAALRQWCIEAEASGHAALAEFSARLKGYALVPVRA